MSTDAHHPKHLNNMRYGILTARRGGLTAADILNTHADREVSCTRCAIQERRSKIMKIVSSKEVYACSLFRVTEEEAVDKRRLAH